MQNTPGLCRSAVAVGIGALSVLGRMVGGKYVPPSVDDDVWAFDIQRPFEVARRN